MSGNKLNVGLLSPGWPLSHCPNGIVAYVETLSDAMSNNANINVFTFDLNDAIPTKIEATDLNRVTINQHLIKKWINYGAYLLKDYPIIKSAAYNIQLENRAIKLSKAIQLMNPKLDVIEMEESYGLAKWLFKYTRLPIVTRLHGPHFGTKEIMSLSSEWNYQLRVDNELEGILISKGVTSPSLDVLNRVRDFYNIALDNAAVIPNPVSSPPADKIWTFDNQTQKNILFVGRFDAVKGADLMLEAFNLVAKEDNDVNLHFVGPDSGLLKNGKLINFEEYISMTIESVDIKSRITFYGHLQSKEVKALRKSCLITVVPSRHETFGISLVEALSFGCPTITSHVGGIKEIAIDEFNAILAEPNSYESFAEKIIYLMNKPSLMLKISKNARADALNRFSPERIAKQTLAYYQTIL